MGKKPLNCEEVLIVLKNIKEGGLDEKTNELLGQMMEPILAHIAKCESCLKKAEELGLSANEF